MADLKISQLPAAGVLTGAELIELVQAGANVQSNVTNVIAAVVPQIVTAATVNGTFASQSWALAIQGGNFSSAINPPIGPGNQGNIQTFTGFGGGSNTDHGGVPSASTWYGTTDFLLLNTAAIVNDSKDASFAVGASGHGALAMYRKLSGGMALAGFTVIFIGGFDTFRSDQTAFIGLVGTQGGLGGAAIPSAQVNSVGFGKDQGDANLQFMVNNGSGSATKTDTGLVFGSAIGRHLFQITLTCDAAGALVTAQIKDLEPASPFATKNFTVADGATKIPVADALLFPHIYVGTGTATGTIATIGFKSLFVQSSPIGA